MLIAGIIVAVYSLLNGYTMERTTYTLLLVLFVFYLIGSIIQAIINRVLQNAEASEQEAIKIQLDEAARSLEEINKEENA